MRSGFLTLCLLLTSSILTAEAERKNVLFIITDDLNCNIGAYDHPVVQTPHIDRLARQGVTFLNAYCNFPQCGQSRASFMTGLYPRQTGVIHYQQLFRDYLPDVVTLPQHFMANGYTSARVGKLYHYNNPSDVGTNGHDDKRSWHERINPRGIDKDLEDVTFSLRKGSFGGTMSWLAAPGEDEDHTDGMVATESIALLERYAESQEPFFLGVGFFKPHTPYVAPAKYWTLYDRDKIVVPEVPDGYLDTLPPRARQTLTRVKNQLNLPHELAQEAIQAYYATITFMDAQVGRVLQALEALGLSENTIVVFTSDHGYHMGEHGYYQKRTLFEDAARVPLIIRSPDGSQRGKRTASLVEMIDFYRTLSDMAGLPAPPEYVLGTSLKPIFETASTEVREDALTCYEFGYALRTPRYRLMLWDDGEMELYDHQTDPAEMHNLAGSAEHAAIQHQLLARITARITEAETPARGQRFIPPEKGDRGGPMDHTNS